MISSTFRNLVVRSAVVFTMLASTPVSAWDGVVSGTINTVEVTAGHNFGFRISLVGVGTMCTGGGAIAFLNESDSNYKTYVAALIAARAQGSSVTIYSDLDNGHCHIGHIAISGGSTATVQHSQSTD